MRGTPGFVCEAGLRRAYLLASPPVYNEALVSRFELPRADDREYQRNSRMSVLLLVPGLISLFLVLRGRIETAFLSVYLPCLLLLPETTPFGYLICRPFGGGICPDPTWRSSDFPG